MPRKQVDPVGFTEAVRPVASPVDTYSGPPAANAGLMGLAEGLQGLNSGLSAIIQKRANEQLQADQVNAEAIAQENRNVGYAEAVRRGIIPADASKAFVQAYKTTQGAIAGSMLVQKAQAAYDSWDGKNDEDPSNFDKFLGEFVKTNVTETDPWVLKGLLPAVNDIGSTLGNRYAQDRHARVYGGLTTGYGAQSNQILEAGSDNIGEDGKVNYTPAFDAVEKSGQDKIGVGVKEDDVWNMAMQTVAATALSRKDPALLDFFDRKVPGKDYTYGETPDGQKIRMDTKAKLDDILRSESAAAWTMQERQDKAKRDAYTSTVIEVLAKDPNAQIPEDVLAGGSKYDPQFRTHVLEWSKAMADGGHTSDPDGFMALKGDIIDGGRLKGDGTRMSMQETIQDAMDRHVIRNATDLQSAWELSQSVSKSGQGGPAILKDATAEGILNTINQRSQGDSLNKQFNPAGITDLGMKTQVDFKLALMEWDLSHPNADPGERQNAIWSIGQTYLKRFPAPQEADGAVVGGGEVPTAASQAGAPSPAQPGPSAKPSVQMAPTASAPLTPGVPFEGADRPIFGSPAPATPSGPTPSASPAPSSATPANPEATSWYQGLSPQAQSLVNATAQRSGQTVDQFIGTVLANPGLKQSLEAVKGSPPATPPGPQTMATPDGTPISPASFDPQKAMEFAQSASSDVQERDPELYRAMQNYDIPAIMDRLNNYASMANEFNDVLTKSLDSLPANTGSFTLAAIKDNPQAARILDFVSNLESRGNYNAVSGNAMAQDDLSKYTVDQILTKQSKGWGGPSSAIGRYQIIRKTLTGLKAQLGLTGSEKFTPELQDQLGLQLLKSRGYDKFVSGGMSPQAFAMQLAMEWASMPRPDTGRSYYAGDAVGNKNLTSAKKVRQLLDGVSQSANTQAT